MQTILTESLNSQIHLIEVIIITFALCLLLITSTPSKNRNVKVVSNILKYLSLAMGVFNTIIKVSGTIYFNTVKGISPEILTNLINFFSALTTFNIITALTTVLWVFVLQSYLLESNSTRPNTVKLEFLTPEDRAIYNEIQSAPTPEARRELIRNIVRDHGTAEDKEIFLPKED